MADAPRGGWTAEHDARASEAVGVESWERWIELEEDRLGRKICGARNQRDEPCGNYAGQGTDHKGIGRCKQHGGNNRRGTSHPDFRHGRYAESIFERVLPDDWRERLQDAEGADEMDVARQVLRQQWAELHELLDQLRAKQDMQSLVEEVHEISRDTLAGMEEGDPERVAAGLRQLERVTRAGQGRGELLERIHDQQDRIILHTRRLMEMLKDAHVMVRLDAVEARMFRFVQDLRRAIERHVSDEQEQERVLQRAAEALRPLLNPGQNGGPPVRPE